MFRIATATAVHQTTEASGSMSSVMLLLAAGAFVALILRLAYAEDLANALTTVGSVITAVIVVTVVAVMIFAVLLAGHALLTL